MCPLVTSGVYYTDTVIYATASIYHVDSNTIILSDPTSSNYTKLSPTLDSNGIDLLQIKSVNIETGEDTQIQRLEINSILSGINPTASAPGAATFGINNIATNTGSFVEGVGTLATGFAAHAAGFNTTASGYAAFSMGIETDADGTGSFAVGSGSWARGDSSVAMGIGTIASASGQVTIGHFNFPLNSPDHLFVVGGGTGSATSARGNLLEVYGGIGSTYKAVKIDVGSTFTQTSSPPQGFSIYGNTVFQGNITGSVRVGGSNIILNDDSTNNINATSSFTILDTDRSIPSVDSNKLVINRFGIDFNKSNKSTSPGSKYLWTDNNNRLYYGSNIIILNDGNTLGATMTIGTTDVNNLQLKTNNTTRVFISSSGNVGIGTTSPTLATLQIQGNVSASSYTGSLFGTASWATNALTASNITPAITNNTDNRVLTATGGGTINGEPNLTFSGSTLSVNNSITTDLLYATEFYTNLLTTGYDATIQRNITIGGEASVGSSNLYVSSSGRVGIGTTTTTAKLHISGASSDNLLRVSSPSLATILFVTGSGRVGIGTSTPSQLFEVVKSSNTKIVAGDNVGIQTTTASDWIHLSTDPSSNKYLNIDVVQRDHNNPPDYTPSAGASNRINNIIGNIPDNNTLGTPDYYIEIKLNGEVVLIPAYSPA